MVMKRFDPETVGSAVYTAVSMNWGNEMEVMGFYSIFRNSQSVLSSLLNPHFS